MSHIHSFGQLAKCFGVGLGVMVGAGLVIACIVSPAERWIYRHPAVAKAGKICGAIIWTLIIVGGLTAVGCDILGAK